MGVSWGGMCVIQIHIVLWVCVLLNRRITFFQRYGENLCNIVKIKSNYETRKRIITHSIFGFCDDDHILSIISYLQKWKYKDSSYTPLILRYFDLFLIGTPKPQEKISVP